MSQANEHPITKAEPVSRRRFIGTSAALAALAAVGSATAIEADDAELFQLEAEYNAAQQRWSDDIDADNEIEEQFSAEWPAPEWPESIPMLPEVEAEFRRVTVSEHEMMLKYASDHPYCVWHRENEAATSAARDAWYDATGQRQDELKRRRGEHDPHAACAVLNDLSNAILDTPAMTLAGTLVKLRLGKWFEDNHEDLSRLIQSVTADIERMAGGGNA